MLVFNDWKSPDWLTVGFLNFVLVFMLTFGEGTSVCNFLFISNSEENIPELLLVVCSDNMAKYRWLSSSFYFPRVFVMVWIALAIKRLLWGNLGLEVLCIKSSNLENVLNLLWMILRCIVTKYYLGYAMFCKYTSHMGNDCIWWSIL